MVSLPEPVASTYPQKLGERIRKEVEGRPLGERLMCAPRRGADAVKKTGWLRAQVERSGGMEG